MKTKDRELTIFTPGLSSQSLNMDYYEINNMIVSGLTGSGKDTALTAVVKSMIESNKVGKFSYVYIDGMDTHNPLANSGRITPYKELQLALGYGLPLLEVYQMLVNLCTVVGTKCEGTDTDPKLVDGTLVVIINNFGAMPEYLQLLVRYLMKWTVSSSEMKVIVACQPSECTRDMLENAPYRLCTRLVEEESNRLLGCNIAARRADKYGTAWFYNIEEPDKYTKHVVNYTPDSLLNRMMKTYASGKPSNCRIVHKYRVLECCEFDKDLRAVLNDLFDVDAYAAYEDLLVAIDKEVSKYDK